MICPFLSSERVVREVKYDSNGKIVEQDTHQQLLDQRGFFHNLYISQFKGQQI